MSQSNLPNLTPQQVIALRDSLLANADRLLTSALVILKLGSVGLARSLAILGMEESGKAIAIHERRVQMAYAPEGEPFVNDQLNRLWASHPKKLRLVHDFLVREQYWFGTEPSDPEANHGYLGTIERWTDHHNTLKQRGFYVDVGEGGAVLTPTEVPDEESLAYVISHVHQVGWQLRLGEHIEATRQHEAERGVPPASEEGVENMRRGLSRMEDDEFVEGLLDSMRRGVGGKRLNNDPYRLRLNTDPSLGNLGKPGYEAQARELMRLRQELDERDAAESE